MKFHLSTLLLAIVIVALGLGWYLDHNDPRRTEIVGTWGTTRYSGCSINYFTNLDIRADGTFSKREWNRFLIEDYEGTYQSLRDGAFEFHVTLKKNFDGGLNETSPPVRLDHKYKLHCAIDATGWLLMSDAKESDMLVEQFPGPVNDHECKISWESSFEREK